MTKFEVHVDRTMLRRSIETTTIEVEARSEKEAKAKAEQVATEDCASDSPELEWDEFDCSEEVVDDIEAVHAERLDEEDEPTTKKRAGGKARTR